MCSLSRQYQIEEQYIQLPLRVPVPVIRPKKDNDGHTPPVDPVISWLSVLLKKIQKYSIPQARYQIAIARGDQNNPLTTGAEPYAYGLENGLNILVTLAAKAIMANVFPQECLHIIQRHGDWRHVLGSAQVLPKFKRLVALMESQGAIDDTTLSQLDQFMRQFVASARAIKDGENTSPQQRAAIERFRDATERIAGAGCKPEFALSPDGISELWKINPATVRADERIQYMQRAASTLSEVEVLVLRFMRAAGLTVGSAPIRGYLDLLHATNTRIR